MAATPRPGRYTWRQTCKQVLANATHCGICGQPLNPHAAPNSRDDTTVDHIIPVNTGGTDDLANLQAAHRFCNASKGDRVSAPLTHTRRWLP